MGVSLHFTCNLLITLMGRRPKFNTLKIVLKTYDSGTPYYLLQGKIGDEFIRKKFPNKAEALKTQRKLEIEANGHQEVSLKATHLSLPEIRDAEMALGLLRRQGIAQSLTEVSESFMVGYKAVTAITWEDGVEFFSDWRKTVRKVRDITDQADTSVLMALGREAGATDLRTLDLTALKKALYNPKRANRTQRDYRDLLHNFFEWLVNENYYSSNPIKNWERPKVEKQEVVILTHTQVRDLLNHSGSMLPYFAITLFSGVRPHEARRLTWEELDLHSEHPCIWVKQGRTKTRRGRVSLLPNLLEILKYCNLNRDKFPGPGHYYRPEFDGARKAAGVLGPSIWVNDVCRHTFASNVYLSLLHEGKSHIEAVSQLIRDMRTSENMLWDSYITQVIGDDAREYGRIVPECLKAGTFRVGPYMK